MKRPPTRFSLCPPSAHESSPRASPASGDSALRAMHLVGGGNLGELIYERQRHCRQHALTAALPPTCIHSGIVASMHSHSGIAASMQRHCRHAALPPVCSGTAAMQRALTAALPPACVHSGIAASMHSLRHCRQQALTAALPPFCLACAAVPLNLNSCCHFGSSAST